MKRLFLFVVLALVALACRGGPSDEQRNKVYDALRPSPTPAATQTPIVISITEEVIVQITTTPRPTPKPTKQPRLCVSATEAVNLRPSPSDDNYPIVQLKNGDEVTDLGGRTEEWIFVETAKGNRGWVHEKYLTSCN